MRAAFVIWFGVLMATSMLTSVTAEETLTTRADGWHTWQVDEPGVSSGMCCFSWKRGTQQQKGCNLDAGSIAFSDGEDCGVTPGTLQVWVRIKNGEPADIRVLSANCPVAVEGDPTDHGMVTATDNLAWFQSIIENRTLDMDTREEALFGLVQSESDAAYAYIDSLLTAT